MSDKAAESPPTAPPAGDAVPPPQQPSFGGGDHVPPPSFGVGDHVPPPPPPPGFGAGDRPRFSRGDLFRPLTGRYVAGVCAGMGRATNTDPVLWRVVLAVLTFAGGFGLLIYLIGWLVIPDEGDTGSPIESVLGRGRSRVSPASVLLLAVAAVLSFAFVVNDGPRAMMLIAGVALGGFVLLKRTNAAKAAGASATANSPGATSATEGSAMSGATTATGPTPPPFPPPPGAPAAAHPTPEQPAPAATPFDGPLTASSGATGTAVDDPTVTIPLVPPPDAGYPAPPAGPGVPPPPPSGYRPPFAPHGPWGSSSDQPSAPAAWPSAPAPAAPCPPKPRERSVLGRVTFFLIPVALGVVALLDLTGVAVQPSTYFAAALATTALGLLVGAWFGRARGLIVLALLCTIGLAATSAGERLGGPTNSPVWQPRDVTAMAERYETRIGDATLDLRAVDFTGHRQDTAVQIGGGRLRVLLPPNVDAAVSVDVEKGRVRVFGQERSGFDIGRFQVDDLGADGVGGGELRLNLMVGSADVEVVR